MDKEVEIHVRLLGEGVEVSRPTKAIRVGWRRYKILPTPDYDTAEEDWEFKPDSIVRLKKCHGDSGQYFLAVSPINKDITGAFQRKEYGWFILYIALIVWGGQWLGLGGIIGGCLISFGLYEIIKRKNYSPTKKIVLAVGCVAIGVEIALGIAYGLIFTIKGIWPSAFQPANLPAVSSTSEIPATSGYKNYQNQLMTINWLRYPQDWSLDEASDKLSFTINAPDNHADIGGTLYAETSSMELSPLLTGIQHAAQSNGITIDSNQIKTINGNKWLEYNYLTHTKTKSYGNVVAIYIIPLNDNRQFVKLQLESDGGYSATDSAMFDAMLSSVNFAN